MSDDNGQRRGSAAGGVFGWVLVLSVLLGWIPILGPFFAGIVGGWKSRRPDMAFAGALIPAILWTVGLMILSKYEVKVGGQYVVAGPLFYLGPITGAAILGGALIGSAKRGAAILGTLVFAAGAAYFAPKVHDVCKVVKDVREATQSTYVPEKNMKCPDNLKQLYNAVLTYADSWNDALPPADNWMTAIKDYVTKDEWLHCPEASTGQADRFGYSFNPVLGGKKRKEIPDPKTMPMIYDSTDLTMNAHAGPENIPKPGRHTGKNNVIFADGTVAQK